ncbi:MAG: SDR family oxidoreductase [Bacteroidetes bacterium]|nr:MAG: SDR family oxidoreductase [Bacteroidota bacterium]
MAKFHTTDLSKFSFLVTGGAGFIGSNIAEYLLSHNAKKVVVYDNLATGFEDNIRPFLSLPGFRFIKDDICDLNACKNAFEGIDYVFHQAALGSVPRSIENPIATHNANASGFLSVLVAAKNAGVKRIVYASSSSVYGDIQDSPKQEKKIGKPLSPYAVSKLVNEFYADIFSRTYNMEIIGLRYFNIFGPRQNPKGAYAAAIPLFIDGLLNNTPVYINSDGEQSRDFTYVENAVQGNIKAMFCTDKKALGSVFNIALGDSISVNQLFNTLKKITGASLSPAYRDERKGDVKNSMADISKAAHILGYSPSVNVEDGLRQTVEWFNNYFRK